MPNPITTLLSRTSGSAGQVKAARRPSPNRVNYWPADEMNAVLDFVVLASSWLGLSDGSTADTIFQALRAFSGPRATTFKTFDDFVDGLGTRFTSVLAGGGTATHKAGLNEVGGGNSIIELVTPNAGGASAAVYPLYDSLRGSQLPDLRMRFKTPTSFVGVDLRIGLSNVAQSTYARLRMTGTGTVLIETKSVAGGGTGSVATTTVLGTSQWYELRAKVLAGRVDYYINDALIAQESTAARIPVAADTMAFFLAQLDRTSVGPHTVNIDWFELAAARL